MLLILHGDNTVLSRQKLNHYVSQVKANGVKDISYLNGKKITLTEVLGAVESQSLFASEKLVVIEDLHANKSKTALKELIDYLASINTNYVTSSILIWENKALTATQLKKLANFKPELFKTSPVVFKFLDAIGTIPNDQLLKLFDEAVKKDSAEFIFFMLARLTRQLLQINDPDYKLPPWQIGKLKSQFRSLGEERLTAMHKKLHEIDWHNKSGQSMHGVEGELALLFATL